MSGVLYPWSDGSVRREDPTYGQIDHDIQWYVHRHVRVGELARRAAWERTLQDRRNAGFIVLERESPRPVTRRGLPVAWRWALVVIAVTVGFALLWQVRS